MHLSSLITAGYLQVVIGLLTDSPPRAYACQALTQENRRWPPGIHGAALAVIESEFSAGIEPKADTFVSTLVAAALKWDQIAALDWLSARIPRLSMVLRRQWIAASLPILENEDERMRVLNWLESK